MSTRTPAIIHNENLHIHRGAVGGKGVTGGKGEAVKKDKRKALADVSNALKPLPPRDKSALRGIKKPRKTTTSVLTDDDIEHCHFTGNDAREAEKEIQEQRVKKEVDMVMSSLCGWSQTALDVFAVKEAGGDLVDVAILELEPDLILPKVRSSILSDREAGDPPLNDELIVPPVMDFAPIELKMKGTDDEIA